MVPTLTELFTIEPLAIKDYLVGFFMALSLKRGRIKALLDNFVPTDDSRGEGGDGEK